MSKTKIKHHGKIRLWAGRTSTIISIMLVLFVFGLLLFIEYHSYMATHTLQERITYQVDLTPSTTEEEALNLCDELQKLDYVRTVDYISADQAALLFSKELGEDILSLLDSVNPLYPTLMVTLKASHNLAKISEQRKLFEKEVQEYSNVDYVTYHENMLDDLSQIFYKLSWFLIIFVALLLLITIVLINSLIRIAIYGQRETISTMRLVGAKVSFISRPFLLRSLWYGGLGGLIAGALTIVTLWVFGNEFQLPLVAPQHWLWYGVIAAALVVSGMLIAWLSTAITVRRYIRQSE